MRGTTRPSSAAAVTAVGFLLIAAAAVTGGGAPAEVSPLAAPRGRPVSTIEPSGVIDVEPCCEPGVAFRDRLPPALVDGDRHPPPEGRLVDEETWRALKARAEADERAPIGREIRVEGEPGPGEGPDVALPVSSTPKLRTSFDGVDQTMARTFPPDTQVAVGPEHVLEAVNRVLRLSSRDNRDVEFQGFTAHWDQPPSAFLFDPRVHYDPMSRRFFVLVVEVGSDPRRSYAYLSVSRSARPEGLASGWCNYRFSTKVGKTWADYPGLGMNERWLAVNTNNMRFSGGHKGSYLWVVDKVALADNSVACPGMRIFKFAARRDAANRRAFITQVAQHYTASGLPGEPLFLVNTRFGSSDVYVLWRIRGEGDRAADGSPRLERANLAGGEYALPPDALQRGGGTRLDTLGNWVMQQLVFRDGNLWGAHATGCRIGGRNVSCVRVFRIVPTADAGEIDFEDTFGVKGQFVWAPAIAVNGRGQAVVAFQRSGANVFMGVGFSGLRRGVASADRARIEARGFGHAKFLMKGACTAQHIDEFGRARTGDYAGAMVDPADDRSFWIAAEYGAVLESSCAWATRIGRVSY